jgi:hypothetical protein
VEERDRLRSHLRHRLRGAVLIWIEGGVGGKVRRKTGQKREDGQGRRLPKKGGKARTRPRHQRRARDRLSSEGGVAE